MERLTEYELDKYETILKQIEEEHTNDETLQKQLDTLTNSLRVMKVLTMPEFARENLFQVRVKLFNSTHEFSKVFPERLKHHELEALKKDEAIFYSIEIFVSDTFHKQLIKQAWIFNISIRNNSTCVGHTLNIKNRFSNPFCVLIPFEASNDETRVDVFLSSPGTDDFWPVLKIASIDVDVSYRWDSYSHHEDGIQNDVIKIDRVYNESAPVLSRKNNLMRYQYHCNWTQNKFVEVLLKNSYHKLDLSKILTVIAEDMKVKLNLDGNLSVIELDRALKVLKVEAVGGDLSRVKKYLMRFGGRCKKRDFEGCMAISQLKDAGEELHRNLKYNQPRLHEILNVYESYLRFVSSYPLLA